MHLETDRLVLRRLTPGDAGELHALHTDPEVMRWLGRPDTTLEHMREVVLPDMLRWYQRAPWQGYFVAQDAAGAFLGWFLLRPARDREPVPGEIEIGWRFHRAAWGRGYATEGAAALLADAFTTRGVERVFAGAMAGNTASQRVMEKIGLRYVRTHHPHVDDPLPGTEDGEVEYALTREEWEAARAGRASSGPSTARTP